MRILFLVKISSRITRSLFLILSNAGSFIFVIFASYIPLERLIGIDYKCMEGKRSILYTNPINDLMGTNFGLCGS